jgi:hypothetical protein
VRDDSGTPLVEREDPGLGVTGHSGPVPWVLASAVLISTKKGICAAAKRETPVAAELLAVYPCGYSPATAA